MRPPGAAFDDAVAAKTEWTPLVRGGANFATHRLVKVSGTRIEFKKSLQSFLFGGVFAVVGLGVSAAGLVNAAWELVLFGLPFTAVGAWVVWPRSVVFDGDAREFSAAKRTVPFGSIHALQIIREHVSSSDSDYWSYELNLVLTDGSRINVVDHGDLARVRRDVVELAGLLGCRVWDAAQ
jgi:hypothetical protein